ncbi:MucR family transcriptional regulator [Enterovirga sp. CN4-39]|uniref:MucR family transcriptional regulator n=1 Tax=Enterovirga sp. CN4-39 TaxID=3400910 RepID=UPI003BFE501E
MAQEEHNAQSEITELTVGVVSAFVANNAVAMSDLPRVIASVHEALSALGKPKTEVAPERPVPPVPIRKSITPDYLISLEDGRQYKSLKRHLSGRGLTPEQYRTKWGLPADYPMVAPSYARQRSELAKALGLGRSRAKPIPPPKRGGRRRAA